MRRHPVRRARAPRQSPAPEPRARAPRQSPPAAYFVSIWGCIAPKWDCRVCKSTIIVYCSQFHLNYPSYLSMYQPNHTNFIVLSAYMMITRGSRRPAWAAAAVDAGYAQRHLAGGVSGPCGESWRSGESRREDRCRTFNIKEYFGM